MNMITRAQDSTERAADIADRVQYTLHTLRTGHFFFENKDLLALLLGIFFESSPVVWVL